MTCGRPASAELHRSASGSKLTCPPTPRPQVDGVPGAMAAFKGRLLVGVDNNLRLYDMGALRGSLGGGCVLQCLVWRLWLAS